MNQGCRIESVVDSLARHVRAGDSMQLVVDQIDELVPSLGVSRAPTAEKLSEIAHPKSLWSFCLPGIVALAIGPSSVSVPEPPLGHDRWVGNAV